MYSVLVLFFDLNNRAAQWAPCSKYKRLGDEKVRDLLIVIGFSDEEESHDNRIKKKKGTMFEPNNFFSFSYDLQNTC